MYHTERKHWINGYQVRGGSFWTLTFNISQIGVMICKPSKMSDQWKPYSKADIKEAKNMKYFM